MENVHPELEGLNPGDLQMWRRQHRKEILDYFDEKGDESTMKRYRFSRKDALDRFIKYDFGYHNPRPHRLTETQRNKILAEMAVAGSAENRKEIQELKKAYTQFVESVGEQLAQKLFLPLLRMTIKLDPSLELKPDRTLSIESLFEQPQEEAPDVVAEAEKLLEEPQSEHDIYAEEAIVTIVEVIVDAGNNPDKVYNIDGQRVVDFHNLILEYADELKALPS